MNKGFQGPGEHRRDERDERDDRSNFQETIIKVNRVSKTVKGGRNFGFSVLSTVGDKNGSVGIGMGKAKSVPNAIMKSLGKAKKQQIKISLDAAGRTIPHPQIAFFGASKIVLLPAAPGTGVIAGGAVRPIMEALGIKDILTKAFGSRNPVNLAKATIKALKSLKNADAIAKKRGLDPKSVFTTLPKARGQN